jgi:3-oxoacyl-[acyl-carrier protein] reductase
MDLDRHTALVTGGDRGIGRAIAGGLAEVGVDVAVGYGHDRDGAERQVERIRQKGRRAVAVGADLSDPEQALALVDQAEAALGPIDILVSNAGIAPRQTLEEITLDDWDRVMNVNLRPAFVLVKRMTPVMRQRGWGRVILLSSVAAFTGGVIGPHYTASKAALNGLVHALAKPLAPYGVTVNAVAPALTDTDMLPGDAEERARLVANIPVGRFGKPEEVAQAVLSLIANPYVTSQVMLVDGGVYPR